MRLAGPMPAQLTRMRAGPCLSRAALSAVTASSELVTSQRTAKPPILPAVSFAPSMLMSRQATLAPALASCTAVSAPRPEAAPVTMAACPLGSMLFPFVDRDHVGRSCCRIKLLDQGGAAVQH